MVSSFSLRKLKKKCSKDERIKRPIKEGRPLKDGVVFPESYHGVKSLMAKGESHGDDQAPIKLKTSRLIPVKSPFLAYFHPIQCVFFYPVAAVEL